jgi:putative sigma-54 modulation protein
MEIRVVQRRKEWGFELQEYATDKVQHLSRYYDAIISVDIVFDVERERQICELMAHLARKKMVKARGESSDLRASIDSAVDKLKQQLRRYKSKLREHTHVREEQTPQSEASPDSWPSDQAPRIRRTLPVVRKPMTPEEAALHLDSSPRGFLVFMDAERQKFSVIHRLDDGTYELIEPQY